MSGASEQATTLFLVWHGAGDTTVTLGDDTHALAPGLFLVRSERTRSKVYHAVKRQLPPNTPLLTAPLSGAPKFKGMAPGALRWLGAGA